MLKVREVMTAEPIVVPERTTLPDVARAMHDHDIGDVVVGSYQEVVGILTDRDMVVRGLASDGDIRSLTAGDLCSRDVTTVGADDPVTAAIELMRTRAVRRLPVTDNGSLVGIVSLGDLAQERDPESALADISEASPNN